MTSHLTMCIISDSLGDTAYAVANAAAGQFPEETFDVERLPQARTLDEIVSFIESHRVFGKPIVVLHTFVDRHLRREFKDYAVRNGVYEVDLIGPAIDALSSISGEKPLERPGVIHETDAGYFARIEAMEYTVSHDDGRNFEDAPDADIVLIGVSRTSKTPLSLQLASRGYRVANLPLALGVEPPEALFRVDTRRLFGLMSDVDTLSEIRYKRLGNAVGVAGDYAEPESVREDLESARALMRRLGCIVIKTNRRAIEETAQEILRYYKTSFDEGNAR